MIFIIIPAYNEEENIGRVVRGLFEIKHRLAQMTDGFTQILIVMVDDGSDDRTGEIARLEGAEVLKHEINRGQGAALQTGHEYALKNGADAVVDFDADGQFNPADITLAIEAMRENKAEVVFGSRFLDSRSRVPWLKRYFILPVGCWLNFIFTGIKLTDAHNGFRVLSRRVLETIRITQDKMAHNTEIVRQIKKHNLKFIEFPVEVTYYEYGQGIGGGLNIIKDLFIGLFK